jgi:hypothetical protein
VLHERGGFFFSELRESSVDVATVIFGDEHGGAVIAVSGLMPEFVFTY